MVIWIIFLTSGYAILFLGVRMPDEGPGLSLSSIFLGFFAVPAISDAPGLLRLFLNILLTQNALENTEENTIIFLFTIYYEIPSLPSKKHTRVQKNMFRKLTGSFQSAGANGKIQKTNCQTFHQRSQLFFYMLLKLQ